MEISSTIDKKWRLCTLVSFLGCIIILFCLNQGQDGISLPALQNVGVPVASYNDSDQHPAADSVLVRTYNGSGQPPAADSVNVSALQNVGVPDSSYNVSDQRPGVDNVKVSVLQNISVPVTTQNVSVQHPAAKKQQLESLNVIEYGTEIKEEEDNCNIFEGRWVYDPTTSPLYNESQCPFLSDQVSCQKNGRPDLEFQRWSWEAKGCKIPRFNGTDMLERLRGKRVIIVGDSLNRNQWESLACLLYSAIPSSQAEVHVHSGMYKVFRAKDHNCSVEFYWSPFLVQQEQSRGGKRILRLDQLSAEASQWHGADVMVFNTGHWWIHTGKTKAWDYFLYKGKLALKMETEAAFKIAMNTWARWVDLNVNKNTTKVFFRSVSPEHKGKQWCFNKTKPITDESYITIFPKSVLDIVERTIGGMTTPVKYLNITKLSQYRIDAHPTVFTSKQGKLLTPVQRKQPEFFADCSHWCMPGVPDTWNRLLYSTMFFENINRYS